MLAVVLVRWTEAARLTRTLVLRTLSEEWLTAARAAWDEVAPPTYAAFDG